MMRRLLWCAAAVVAQQRPRYTFWSSDFHISPIHDLKAVLGGLGQDVVDKSLSGHCHLTKTCAKGLKVITKQNGINLGKCPNRLRREFYDAYKDDPEMATVDAFVCQHAAGLCEVFMAFGRPLVVVASTRYEIGRHDPKRWKAWSANLRRIAADPRNIVAANNLYDARYIEYFTGLRVPVYENWCGYAAASAAKRPNLPVLVGPGGRDPPAPLVQKLKRLVPGAVKTIKEAYPGRFEYAQLARHPALVLIPYQVSVMSLFEYYRMCLPLFVPTKELLWSWHRRFALLKERTWFGVHGKPRRASPLPRHGNATLDLFDHDPNDDLGDAAALAWHKNPAYDSRGTDTYATARLELSDFYAWPHITTFESIDAL